MDTSQGRSNQTGQELSQPVIQSASFFTDNTVMMGQMVAGPYHVGFFPGQWMTGSATPADTSVTHRRRRVVRR